MLTFDEVKKKEGILEPQAVMVSGFFSLYIILRLFGTFSTKYHKVVSVFGIMKVEFG